MDLQAIRHATTYLPISLHWPHRRKQDLHRAREPTAESCRLAKLIPVVLQRNDPTSISPSFQREPTWHSVHGFHAIRADRNDDSRRSRFPWANNTPP